MCWPEVRIESGPLRAVHLSREKWTALRGPLSMDRLEWTTLEQRQLPARFIRSVANHIALVGADTCHCIHGCRFKMAHTLAATHLEFRPTSPPFLLLSNLELNDTQSLCASKYEPASEPVHFKYEPASEPMHCEVGVLKVRILHWACSGRVCQPE